MPSNAQTLANLLGKILRLNADGTIPTDNPFFATATGAEPGDLGARPAQSVHVRVQRRRDVDVHQRRRPERRGRRSTTASPAPTTAGRPPKARRPIRASTAPRYSYDALRRHLCASPAARSTPRRSAQFPSDYVGDYFFADYCGGWIRRLDPATDNAVTTFATGISSPVDLQVVGRRQPLLPGARAAGDGRRLSRSATARPRRRSRRSRRAAPSRPARRRPSASAPPDRRRCGISGSATAPTSPARRRRTTRSRRSPRLTTARASAPWSRNDSGSTTSAEAVLTVTVEPGAHRHDHLAAAGTLYSGGQRHQLRGHRHRSRGRRAAGERVHLAGGLPSRHAHPSVRARDQRRDRRLLHDPDDRRDRSRTCGTAST